MNNTVFPALQTTTAIEPAVRKQAAASSELGIFQGVLKKSLQDQSSATDVIEKPDEELSANEKDAPQATSNVLFGWQALPVSCPDDVSPALGCEDATASVMLVKTAQEANSQAVFESSAALLNTSYPQFDNAAEILQPNLSQTPVATTNTSELFSSAAGPLTQAEPLITAAATTAMTATAEIPGTFSTQGLSQISDSDKAGLQALLADQVKPHAGIGVRTVDTATLTDQLQNSAHVTANSIQLSELAAAAEGKSSAMADIIRTDENPQSLAVNMVTLAGCTQNGATATEFSQPGIALVELNSSKTPANTATPIAAVNLASNLIYQSKTRSETKPLHPVTPFAHAGQSTENWIQQQANLSMLPLPRQAEQNPTLVAALKDNVVIDQQVTAGSLSIAQSLLQPEQTLESQHDGTAPVSPFSAAATLINNESAVETLTNQANTPGLDQSEIMAQIVERARIYLRPGENASMVMQLHPEHLGEITLKVSVDNGVVSAAFHSDNYEVRQVIEASLPQLRQELSQQGIKLDNVGVYSGSEQFFDNGQRPHQQQSFIPSKKSSRLVQDTFELEEQASLSAAAGVDYRI